MNKETKKDRIARLTEEAGYDAGTGSGDPFAGELAAKLDQSTRDRVGEGMKRAERLKKKADAPKTRRTVHESNLKARSDGLAVVERALIFVSAFSRLKLGYRAIHIFLMLTGKNPLSVQMTADILGITYYAVRHSTSKMEAMGLIEPRHLENGRGLTFHALPKGRKLARALNSFDPDAFFEYDKLMAIKDDGPTPGERAKRLHLTLQELGMMSMDF